MTNPITKEELSVPVDKPIAVAVSGGADSMALAFCLKRAGADVHAFIVEHGLRAESAEEASRVAGWLNDFDIPATILPWAHEGIETRIHVEARKARYKLLLAACRKQGIESLYVAHHQDDQAETILMRFAKGSGIDGLAGMAPETEQDGVKIIRPFLVYPKARLVATCEVNKVSFVTDPSNKKECYARGRLRKVTDALAAEGFTTERLADLGQRAAEAKEALQFYTEKLCQKAIKLLPSGALELDLEVYSQAPQAVRLRVFTACFMYLNPTSYAPERKQLLLFAHWCEEEKESNGRTFHGAYVSKKRGQLLFMREAAALTDVLAQDGLWDQRWKITGLNPDLGQHVAALGVQEHAVLDAVAPSLRKRMPSGRQRAMLPALWQGNKVIAVLGGVDIKQGLVKASLKPPFWLKTL